MISTTRALWLVLFSVGCSGSGSTGGAGPCNTLVNNAPMVSKNVNAGAAPTMTGGTLMDGTWFLTRMDRYNNSTGSSTHRETWVFSGSQAQIVTDKSTDATQKHFSATYAISGSTLTLSVTCPMQLTLMSAFTATATTLQVINSGDSNELHTFTRQP